MKNIIFLLSLLITNLFSNDFGLEIMSASDSSNATIFKFSDNITYRKGTGKFNNYEGVECLYAITYLANGNGTFQKAKCKF